MALFGTQRDAKFLASINAELLNAIVDTEIEFFKLVVEQSNSNISGITADQNYVLVKDTLKATWVDLSWTEADFGQTLATSYTIQIDKVGSDFSS